MTIVTQAKLKSHYKNKYINAMAIVILYTLQYLMMNVRMSITFQSFLGTRFNQSVKNPKADDYTSSVQLANYSIHQGCRYSNLTPVYHTTLTPDINISAKDCCQYNDSSLVYLRRVN